MNTVKMSGTCRYVKPNKPHLYKREGTWGTCIRFDKVLRGKIVQQVSTNRRLASDLMSKLNGH